MAANVAGFDVLMAEVSSLAAEHTLERVSRGLQAESLKLVSDGFRKSEDPYGTPWAALKSRKGQPLLDTGRLRGSYAPGQANAQGFTIRSNVEYAAAQQYGHTYAARSDAKERTLWQNPKNGRIVGKNTKLKLVVEHKFRATHGQRVLPARPMVPNSQGLPQTWRDAFERVARKAMKGE